MRCYDNGSLFTVCVSESDVDRFNDRWPGSILSGCYAFQFDKRSGDLVDLEGTGDGSELVALSEDACAYGARRLKLSLPVAPR